jgi:hypothetical protein
MLVDRAAAKAHLRILTPDGDPTDLDFDQKLAAAEDHVLDYVSRNEPGTTLALEWTSPDLTPARVQAAVLIVLADLWRFRGDDPGAEALGPGRDPSTDLPRAAMGLLRRFTDPVLA